MDILLERILSLIPKKPDGTFVHGGKKKFADKLGLASNIVAEWTSGRNKSYTNYVYEISAKYGVSVDWLKGKSDEKFQKPLSSESIEEEKEKPAGHEADGWRKEAIYLLERLSPEELERELSYLRERVNGKDS